MTEWIEYTSDWGYWINPDTFRTPRIKKSVRVGAVVFLKERETLEDGRQIIITTYAVAGKSGIKEMDKKEVSSVLALQMLDFMRAHKMYPPKTKMKKSYANGNVDLRIAANLVITQCKNERILDHTMAIPASSAALIDSLSRIDPPGAIIAVTPFSTAASTESL